MSSQHKPTCNQPSLHPTPTNHHPLPRFVIPHSVEAKHKELLQAVNKAQQQRTNDELHKLMDSISQLANVVRRELKAMDQENQSAIAEAGEEGLTAEQRIRKSQHATLSKKFVTIMSGYNDVQAENKRKYRETIKRQCKIVDPDIDDSKVDNMLETGTVEGIFTGKRVSLRGERGVFSNSMVKGAGF